MMMRPSIASRLAAPRRTLGRSQAPKSAPCVRQRAPCASASKAPPSSAAPAIKIDNTSDEFATKLSVSFHSTEEDDSAEMLALTQALQNMDLNIVKGRVRDSSSDPDLRRSTFFITDKHTSDKVLKSEKLEDIRLAVEYTLLEKFPEEGAKLAAADRRDVHRQPRKDGESVVPTRVTVEPHESGTRSILRVKTRDYPGILTEIVRVLKDINLNVTYAEINTVGREVDDTFYVTYHGAALDHNMELLVTNCLQYYISLFELERDESY